jgi:hypothetical protein
LLEFHNAGKAHHYQQGALFVLITYFLILSQKAPNAYKNPVLFFLILTLKNQTETGRLK